MNNVLLLIPANHESQAAVREAIDAAKSRGGTLYVAVAVDPDVIEEVSSTMTEEGFIGEKVMDQVCCTLEREYHSRAEALAKAIVEQAKEQSVSAEGSVEEGDPAEVLSRLVPDRRIGLAILVAERRSWLTRLLSRDAIRLPALAGCEG